MKRRFAVWLGLCAVALVVGCGGGGTESDSAETAEAATSPPFTGRRLDVLLQGKSGSELTGIAIFVRNATGVSLQLNLENTPPGKHAVHIHETGDCSAEDGSSAGGHWNPTSEDHGQWGTAPHHLGDIGNIEVGKDGIGTLSFTGDKWTLGDGGAHDVYGKALIVHAKIDDFKTQPTGAAGARIGCVVIKQP